MTASWLKLGYSWLRVEHRLVQGERGGDAEESFHAGADASAVVGDDHAVTDVAAESGLAGEGYFVAEVVVVGFLDDLQPLVGTFHIFFLSALYPVRRVFMGWG